MVRWYHDRRLPSAPDPQHRRVPSIGAEREESAICGRYLAISSVEELAERFAVDDVRTEPIPPRYNVAPTTDVTAVLEASGRRRLGTLRWGFVAPWADRRTRRPEPINARLETVADSRMFAPSVEHRRCVLPADGFYEWQKQPDGGRKRPHLVAPTDGAPLGFAGLWSSWRDPRDPDADPLYSAAILTTAAVGVMERIHPRMPVILPPGLWGAWMDVAGHPAPPLLDELRHLPAPSLAVTPISTRVNDVRNDDPAVLEPVEDTAVEDAAVDDDTSDDSVVDDDAVGADDDGVLERGPGRQW